MNPEVEKVLEELKQATAKVIKEYKQTADEVASIRDVLLLLSSLPGVMPTQEEMEGN
jgi:hypothetical protein